MRHQNNTAVAAVRKEMRLAVLLLAVSTLGVGGCRQYFDRQDSLTLGVANATETNKAIQTINRWPDASRHDYWATDGEKTRRAIERYRTGKVTEPKQLDAQEVEASPEASAEGAEAAK